jgi:hypothetical protein
LLNEELTNESHYKNTLGSLLNEFDAKETLKSPLIFKKVEQ